jgi:hypothetical protein
LFAACFIESYLLEWTRDEALRGKLRLLDDYLPAHDRDGISERWKRVTKKLHKDGRISAPPNYKLSPAWAEFVKLVRYRDGLVHGRSGRPRTSNTPKNALPIPTVDDLNRIPPGWPTRVVIALVEELHTTATTKRPDWLIDP